MFGLGKLRAAIDRLTAGLNNLAATSEQVNADVRQKLRLDFPEQETPLLEEPANGELVAVGGKRKPR